MTREKELAVKKKPVFATVEVVVEPSVQVEGEGVALGVTGEALYGVPEV